MKIVSLTLKNFRSFGDTPQTLVFNHKLNCFIGLNSSGKTACLEALRKLFGARKERMIDKEDFHVSANEPDVENTEKHLSIEARITFEPDDPAVPDCFDDMVIRRPRKPPYLRIRLEAHWRPSATSLDGEIEANHYIIKVADGESEDDSVRKGFPPFMFNLFQVIYVPALRKTVDQLRYASGSILHRLLKTIEYTDQFKEEYKDATTVINDLFEAHASFKSIQTALQDLWSQFHKDSRYKDVALNFGMGELDEIMRKVEVHFSPAVSGHRTFQVDDLGDGYRSLFYIALVCTLLQIEDGLEYDTEIDGNPRPLLTVLAVEEPENHIAPQILGRVIKILLSMAEKGNTQVFLSSHTPAIVKRLDPESIFHLHITPEGTTEVNRIELPEKTDESYKYVKEAVQNYPEIYFAKLVVIGEGDSEEVIFNRLMKAMDTDFDDNVITFAPLGHRFVSHIWKLLAKINIPHITLLDLDLERSGGGLGRIKYALEELIRVGKDPAEVLATDEGPLTNAELKEMHKWKYDIPTLKAWISLLEEYNVYYSYPLDLDFLMLSTYTDYYTNSSSYPKGGGPNIPAKGSKPAEYDEYLQNAIGATLKDESAKAKLYSTAEKELMIWYKYHFLGRGKPVTHINVLSQIDDETLRDDLPDVFQKIFDKIDEILSQQS